MTMLNGTSEMESAGQELSVKYWLISVGPFLRVEPSFWSIRIFKTKTKKLFQKTTFVLTLIILLQFDIRN